MDAIRRRCRDHRLHTRQGYNFESVLVNISDEILQNELDKMKFLLSSVIPGRKREEITNAYEVFDYLKIRGHIQVDNVSYLVDLLNDISREDLAKKLKNQHGHKRKPYKCIAVGESSCGKTALALRMMHNSFPDDYRVTIDPDRFRRNIYLEDKSVLVELWDTAGMEALSSYLPQQFFRDVSVVLMVFDITRRDTFEQLTKWRNEVRTKCDEDTVVFLIGNKLDLDMTRVITVEMAKEKAEEFGATYFEVSAKTGRNTEDLLIEIGKVLPPEEMLFTNSSHTKTLSLDATTQTPVELRRKPLRKRIRSCRC